MDETRKYLEQMEIGYAGCRDGAIDLCSTKILKIKNKRVGMVGISTVYSELDEDKLKNVIGSISELADIVVVNVHWGKDYKREFN